MRAKVTAGLSAVVAAVSVWMTGAPAAAQEDVIAACRALSTEEQRFSCVADALREANGAGVATPASSLPEQGPQQAAPASQFGPPQPAAPSPQDEQDRVLTASPAEFGAERVEERAAREQSRLTASVVSSELVGFSRLQVELDNGQVWRQAQSEKPWDLILDGEPEAVEIRPSRFGGYRMTVDADRTMSVERIR